MSEQQNGLVNKVRALIDEVSDERFSSDRHWLKFKDGRVVGCHCGFPADPEEGGYGDSILDHIEDVVSGSWRDRLRALLDQSGEFH